jgi:hypothetical protein
MIVLGTDWGAVIIGSLGAVLGGVVGGFVALRSAGKQIQAQQKLQEGQLEHDLALAREERTQGRRGDIHVGLVRYLNWLTQYIAATVHGVRIPIAVEPSQEERDLLLAQVMAHGSRPVREQFESIMRVHVPEVADAKMALDEARPDDDAGLVLRYRRDLNDQKNKLLAAIEAVRSQVQRELQPGEEPSVVDKSLTNGPDVNGPDAASSP